MKYVEVSSGIDKQYFKGRQLEIIDYDSRKLVIKDNGETIAVFTHFVYWCYITDVQYRNRSEQQEQSI